MTKKKTAELIFEGLSVSGGIGIGTVHVRESGAIAVPEYTVAQNQTAAEIKRLKTAIRRAKRELTVLRGRAGPGLDAEDMSYLFDAYLQMLNDSRLIRGAERRIGETRINAEAAIQNELADITQAFSQLDDPYIAARLEDIREIAGRLIRGLIKKTRKPLATIPKGSVIVADELTPADAAQLDPALIAGFATEMGGVQGHTAIMARALGIPAVMGVGDNLRTAGTGDAIIIDGDAGRIILRPLSKTIRAYEEKREGLIREEHQLQRLKRQPAVTRDDVAITLQANMELPIELNVVNRMGAEGVGLLRSEFMFMNRDKMPTEEEQFRELKTIVTGMAGKPVTVRTLDIGGEKITPSLAADFGESTASALGLRGIRLSLARSEFLTTQFRAILRAGRLGPIRILLPMVSTISEVQRARELLKKAASALKRRKVPIAATLPPVGVMIEVPGAALAADSIARASDFFAIGSNDLTMYTLAVDRSDEKVAHLYNPLHPAVLRLIQATVEAGLRAGIPVSLCGEMAGDPRLTALLLGLGFRELSMTAAAIPKVKSRIRDIDLAAAERRVRLIMDQVDAGRIAMMLDDFNGLA